MVWEKAHKLTLAVHKITEVFSKDERFGLTSQVRRACSSIAANVKEGCGRRSEGEMGRYIQIAIGSGAELSYHLLLSKDLGIPGPAEFMRLASDLDEVMRMLSALSGGLKGTARPSILEPRAIG
jgi:four helix bundle protein